jgi:hypothetical protein
MFLLRAFARNPTHWHVTLIMKQSTNHLMMIEPAEFYANPETVATNSYQAGAGKPDPAVFFAGLEEYHVFKKVLQDAGVKITEGKGIKGSPDMVFPNWFFTHESGELILCPMLNPNRQAERTPELIALLKTMYPEVLDRTGYEKEGRALESTASIVSDHINRIAYAALSSRTDEELARQWAEHRGYEIELFETRSHTGIPVYHTDCVMWIGTTLAGICDPVIIGEGRERVVKRLKATHDVVQFTAEQLQTFCGNALEVLGPKGEKFLAISEGAIKSLDKAQMAMIEKHFDKILSAPLYTLEKYGGGSARCMLAELF